MARRLLLSLLWLWTAAAAQTGWRPERSSRLVNDYSGVFSPGELEALEQRLVAFGDSTSNQVAVVVTPTLGGDDEMAVAQRIGQEWGVGQAEFDNGVVVLIKSKTREENWGAVAIATGYGVEGALPDLFCKRIIDDQMLGPLGEGRYYRAVSQALDVMLPVLAGEYSYAQYRKDERRKALVGGGVALLVVAVLLVLIARHAKKHPEQWRNNGGRGGGGVFLGGMPGGMGGGGSWGGFGGFGGGSFGGGGASGRF